MRAKDLIGWLSKTRKLFCFPNFSKKFSSFGQPTFLITVEKILLICYPSMRAKDLIGWLSKTRKLFCFPIFFSKSFLVLDNLFF